MRWEYILAVLCGIPVGMYLGALLSFWWMDRQYTAQDEATARTKAALTRAEARVR